MARQKTKSLRRRQRQHAETVALLEAIPGWVFFNGIVQCGLGDWAEGPALLAAYPPGETMRYMAVEPIIRYCHEAWRAGFRGPIIQGALWTDTGRVLHLQDFRTRTSILDTEPRRGDVETRTLTLDAAMEFVAFDATQILLWMDIEGVELTVLTGAQKTLEKTMCLVCELKDVPKMPDWPSTPQVVKRLASLGFRMIHRVADNGLFVRA